jgi:two-component system response regulator DctR
VEKPYTDDTLVPLIRQALELEEEWSHKAKRGDFLRSMWDSLASQQRRVARFKERGVPNKVSADKMNIVERTVEEHWVKVRDKLGVDSAAELATTMADMRAFGIDVSTEDD